MTMMIAALSGGRGREKAQRSTPNTDKRLCLTSTPHRDHTWPPGPVAPGEKSSPPKADGQTGTVPNGRLMLT